jgi:hypothetical protein
MNRDCNGDYWPTLRLYRCLRDGSLIKANARPMECDNCKRRVSATVHPKTEMRTIKQLKHPTFGWLDIIP